MCGSLVVEHPPKGLVAFKHLVGHHTSDGNVVGLLIGLGEFATGGFGPVLICPRAEFVFKVIVGIFTLFRLVFTVSVQIVEWGEELAWSVDVTSVVIGVCGPVLDGFRHHVVGVVPMVAVVPGHSLGHFKMAVVVAADSLVDIRCLQVQRAGPEVVTDLAEPDGCQFQLAGDVQTSNP